MEFKGYIFTPIFIFCFAISNLLFGQTQLEMNREEQDKDLKANEELNLVYKQILKAYKTDAVFIKNLKTAQRIWVQFRDAELMARFPDREPGYYGSIHPMCKSMYLKELTEERTAKLRTWLKGEDEGMGCTSSVQIK
jgi:uncharacterized protein YecT (DUF1311 family)